jgi:hypothetical protein
VHAEPPREPAGLVYELAARAPVAIDLPEADHVGGAALDLAGDPLEVEPPVHPAAWWML